MAFDLVLVMDKYCAADVLREVSVYDTINKAGNYSAKVPPPPPACPPDAPVKMLQGCNIRCHPVGCGSRICTRI